MSTKNELVSQYGAEAIQVIEGLEAVRKRPAMYIGSTGFAGLHHLVYEVVDNSVDEALAGHCTRIVVTLHADGSCSVEDNGRGIPTDIHPTEKVSATQVVLTKLHAGGKFDKKSYKYSGGLHGVGVSVVNALSKQLSVEVYRDGKIYNQLYERGRPLAPLAVTGVTDKRGTVVRFTPDEEIFRETVVFNFETLSARLRELAFLNKKLLIIIAEEATGKSHEFYFEGGIISFVEHVNSKKKPLFEPVVYFQHDDEQYVMEVALQYNDSFGEQLFSFVNNINTVEGGTHVTGFKGALTKACNKRAQELNLLKNGDVFSSEDVREGLVCVVNMKVPEPQFEGQTKTKLGNSEVKGVVESWCFAALDRFFEENPAVAKLVLQKAETAKRARDAAKKARDLARQKTGIESFVVAGKLAACSSDDPAESELFIVEGDSAGGSAKQGRDRQTQAILPLKGKILNVEKARLDKILSNDEIKSLISTVGCGIDQQEFDPDKVRYHKIILMTDADVDGAHIRTLLLTFFFRYMRPLIERGYVYIAQPPLYKAKIGKKEQYLRDESAFKGFIFDWAKDHASLYHGSEQVDQMLWKTVLVDLYKYEEHLEAVARTFKIAPEQCHLLITALAHYDFKPELNVQELTAYLQANIKKWHISVKYDEELRPEIDGDQLPTRLNTFTMYFNYANKEWSVKSAFFASPEIGTLHSLLRPLVLLEKNEWMLKINDKQVARGLGAQALSHAVIRASKQFMSVQRYKGLGEMNPEQLWETSMDASRRVLLQVTINDAIEADSWFTVLMGDDVAGRRDFIEQNGQFARNLDV